MKLLSICVPTYNRSRDLAELSSSFLAPALDRYSEVLEIIVCDNSDESIAIENKSVLDTRVRYFKNQKNLGFAGNLINCVTLASGKYVWIISDNDPILWDGFEKVMQNLHQFDSEGVDCIMLPFRTIYNIGYSVISNARQDWLAVDGETFGAVLSHGRVPFVLFSAAIIRLDKSVIKDVAENYSKNEYLQVILFASMLKVYSIVRFSDLPVINYKQEYHARWSIYSIARSMTQVRRYLAEHYGAIPNEGSDYRGWLLSLLHTRGGLYQFLGADQDRWKMIAQLPAHFNLKNLALSVALVVPKRIIRPVYLVYCSLMDYRRMKKSSFKLFLEVFNWNRVQIAKNLEGRS